MLIKRIDGSGATSEGPKELPHCVFRPDMTKAIGPDEVWPILQAEGWVEHIPTADELAAEVAAIKLARIDVLVTLVKSVAGDKILAVMPEWKQRNATARAVEIIAAQLAGVATDNDLAELVALRSVYNVIKEIRSASDVIETDVAFGVVTDEDQVRESGHWPSLT